MASRKTAFEIRYPPGCPCSACCPPNVLRAHFGGARNTRSGIAWAATSLPNGTQSAVSVDSVALDQPNVFRKHLLICSE